MPAERFYVNDECKNQVLLLGNELHHLAHVMRVRVGEEIELVNGRGVLATAEVAAITKQNAVLKILSRSETPIPPPKNILAIALMRPSKLEWIIEKGTELGADAFWLFPAQHSDKNDLSNNQMERLNTLAISAMKQCGRLDLPSLQILAHFEDLFRYPHTYLFGDTRPNAPKIEPPSSTTVFITGPESGFSKEEVALLETKAKGVRLNKNILRAETAPIAAMALLA